jgi:hypothetical protein
VISSPLSSAVSICGVSPGRRWNSAIGIRRVSAVRLHGLDRRVERPHGNRHVGRVCRDAVFACTDHREPAGDAAERRAAGPGLALIAGLGGVVEVGAARALQEIAGGRRLVAELAGRAGERRPREHAVVAPHPPVRGQVGVADERPDPQSAVRRRLDRVELEPVHIDQMRRRLDLQLHQVEQVRSARDELRLRSPGNGGGRLGRAWSRART